MQEQDEFYIGYQDESPKGVRKFTRRFVLLGLLAIAVIAAAFALAQKPFKNSSFELTTTSELVGYYHESPYPMLEVKTGDRTVKQILLLGFGKQGANPYLDKLRSERGSLHGLELRIEGNLIYYNGQTLLQITDEEKITVVTKGRGFSTYAESLGTDMVIQGEIVDPKCYFGVMKPGYGKIHRSCAIRCISGGIPPVLVAQDENNMAKYYLITDAEGKPLHQEILSYVGKPAEIKGEVIWMPGWYQLRIEVEDIQTSETPSSIYQ